MTTTTERPPNTAGAANPNLAARLEDRAAELGGKPAFRFDDGEVSYLDFDDRASRVAGGLAALGVAVGDRVAIMAGSHVEFLATLFGIWKLGAISVAINAQLGPAEVAQQLGNSTPRVVVVDEGPFRAVVETATADLAEVPTVVGTGTLDVPALRAAVVEPGSDATIFYTSGTTGIPKGATHTHRALTLQLEEVGRHFSVTRDDVFLSVLPIYLLSILVLGPILSIYNGTTCRLMPRYEPAAFADHVRRDRITLVGASIPMMFADLLALDPDRVATVDLSSIRVANCGGSPMPPEIRREFEERFHFRFVHAYGGTEGPAVVSTDPMDADRKFDSVGVAMRHIRVIVEDEGGQEVPSGTVGEITTSAYPEGPYAGRYEPIRCYWDMPEATAEALRRGRLHWGDMGFVDEDGFLHLVDRKKDMIIRGGMNVYPREIEALLLADDRIADCAVVGAEHPRYGEVPWAFVLPTQGAVLDEAAVAALVSERSARFKHLAGVTFVTEFPRNALGKILKRQLREGLTAAQGA